MWRFIFCFIFLLGALFSEKLLCGYVSCPANSGLLPYVCLTVRLPDTSVWALLSVLCVFTCGNIATFPTWDYMRVLFLFLVQGLLSWVDLKGHNGEFSKCRFLFGKLSFGSCYLYLIWCLLRTMSFGILGHHELYCALLLVIMLHFFQKQYVEWRQAVICSCVTYGVVHVLFFYLFIF